MITSLKIDNFKCFKSLEVKPLARVNLFVGVSNVGKTAMLEAIGWLPHQSQLNSPWNNPQQPQSEELPLTTFRDKSLRNNATDEFRKWLIHNLGKDGGGFELSAPRAGESALHTISLTREQNGTVRLPLPNHSFTEMGCFLLAQGPSQPAELPKMHSVSTDKSEALNLAVSYDRWTRRPENDDRFVAFLKKIDPRLRSLRPMEHTGTRMLYADVGLPERIALPMLGEGFNRLVQIFGSIIGEEANILLIDEIENGLHWTALPQVWAGIRAAVEKEDVQLFATTHSLECISTAVEAFEGGGSNDLAVHRLERRDDGEIHCVTMNEEQLTLMVERGWEVR